MNRYTFTYMLITGNLATYRTYDNNIVQASSHYWDVVGYDKILLNVQVEILDESGNYVA
jgi:hypothetical protein